MQVFAIDHRSVESRQQRLGNQHLIQQVTASMVIVAETNGSWDALADGPEAPGRGPPAGTGYPRPSDPANISILKFWTAVWDC